MNNQTEKRFFQNTRDNINFRRAVLDATFFPWLKRNIQRTDGEFPNSKTTPKFILDLEPLYRSGQMLPHVSDVLGAKDGMEVCNLASAVPLMFVSTERGSIRLDTQYDNVTYSATKIFPPPPSSPAKKPAEEKVKEVEAIPTNIVKGICVNTVPIEIATTVATVSSTLIRPKGASAAVSTIKSNTVFPAGTGAELSGTVSPIIFSTPLSTAVGLLGIPECSTEITKIAQTFNGYLKKAAVPKYQGDNLTQPLTTKPTILDAYGHLKTSRTHFGADEGGLRALSGGAAYGGLFDKHTNFLDYDKIFAVNEWLTYMTVKAPAKGKEKEFHTTKGLQTYNTSLAYYGVTGCTPQLAKRLITNLVIPKGIGVVIDCGITYDSASVEYRLICAKLQDVDVVRYLDLTLEAVPHNDDDVQNKYPMQYKSKSLAYDFIGHLVMPIEGRSLIPLRSIHRGTVLYVKAETPYVHQDLINSMVVANTYRNVWLVCPVSYYQYMKLRLGANNTYVAKYQRLLYLNSAYTDNQDKYIDVDGIDMLPVVRTLEPYVPGTDYNKDVFQLAAPLPPPEPIPIVPQSQQNMGDMMQLFLQFVSQQPQFQQQRQQPVYQYPPQMQYQPPQYQQPMWQPPQQSQTPSYQSVTTSSIPNSSSTTTTSSSSPWGSGGDFTANFSD